MADERKVPVFDWDKMDFATGIGGVVQTVQGDDAVAQVVLKAQQTQLGKFSVYADFEDETLNHIYGSLVHDVVVRNDLPEAVKLSEAEREAREAILYDPWVKDVTDVKAYSQKDKDDVVRYYLDMKVETVFGGTISLKGVYLNE
jgi:hypothetical protein